MRAKTLSWNRPTASSAKKGYRRIPVGTLAPKRLNRLHGTPVVPANPPAALDRRVPGSPAAPRYSRPIPKGQSANTGRSLAPNRRISHMCWVDAVPRHVIHTKPTRLSNERWPSGDPPSLTAEAVPWNTKGSLLAWYARWPWGGRGSLFLDQYFFCCCCCAMTAPAD